MLYFQCTNFYFIGKYLLSYSTLINPLEPDVHHMTSQIVSIWLIFTQTYSPFFLSFSNFYQFIPLEWENGKRQCSWFFKTFRQNNKNFHVICTLTLVANGYWKFLSHFAVQYKFLIKEFQITKVYLRLFSLTVMNTTYQFCLMSNTKT